MFCWHKWNKWNVVTQGYLKENKDDLPSGYYIRQVRQCTKCGKVEQHIDRNMYDWR